MAKRPLSPTAENVDANKEMRTEHEPEQTHIFLSNPHLLSFVFVSLPIKQLVTCSKVSKVWNELAVSDSLWLEKYIRAARLPMECMKRCKKRGIWRQMFLKRFGKFFQMKRLVKKYSDTSDVGLLTKLSQMAAYHGASQPQYALHTELKKKEEAREKPRFKKLTELHEKYIRLPGALHLDSCLRNYGGVYDEITMCNVGACGSVTMYSKSSLAHVTVYINASCDYVSDYGECEGSIKIRARIFNYETEEEKPILQLAKIRTDSHREDEIYESEDESDEKKIDEDHTIHIKIDPYGGPDHIFLGTPIKTACDQVLEIIDRKDLAAEQLIETCFAMVHNFGLQSKERRFAYLDPITEMKYCLAEERSESSRIKKMGWLWELSDISRMELKRQQMIQRAKDMKVNDQVMALVQGAGFFEWKENYGTSPYGAYIDKRVLGVVVGKFVFFYEFEGVYGHDTRKHKFQIGENVVFKWNESENKFTVIGSIEDYKIIDLFIFIVVFADIKQYICTKEECEAWWLKEDFGADPMSYFSFTWEPVENHTKETEEKMKQLWKSYNCSLPKETEKEEKEKEEKEKEEKEKEEKEKEEKQKEEEKESEKEKEKEKEKEEEKEKEKEKMGKEEEKQK